MSDTELNPKENGETSANHDEQFLEEVVETGGNLKGRIEAILFVAGEPVDAHDLARVLGISLQEVEQTLDELRDEYDFAQRGFMLRRFGYQVQLTTRRLYSRDVINLLQPVQKQSLSQAVMETLAIVAYKQPITKAEMELIRGVKCDYSVQTLNNKGLIAEVGRKDALGHPILYGTTDAFLQHFGIESLSELPPLPEGEIENKEPAPKLTP